MKLDESMKSTAKKVIVLASFLLMSVSGFSQTIYLTSDSTVSVPLWMIDESNIAFLTNERLSLVVPIMQKKIMEHEAAMGLIVRDCAEAYRESAERYERIIADQRREIRRERVRTYLVGGLGILLIILI